jgi:signal transduction histidine kinase
VVIDCDFQGAQSGAWDGGRLIEALSNLIGNAMEYATVGSTVRLHAQGSDAEVVLEVQNDGPAIPPELLPVLFEPFRSGRQGPQVKAGHLGLGLYIAHEIVTAHGGTLEAESANGVTSFRLRLPRY